MSAPQSPAPATTSAPSTPSVQSLCSMCKNPAKDVCNACHCSRYCSKICQKDDWPVHKLLCRSFKDFSLSKAPGPNEHRAIHFAEEGTQPKFFWVEMTPEDLKGPGSECGRWHVQYFKHNDVIKRPHQLITVFWPKQGGGINKSLRKIDQQLAEARNGSLIFHGQCAHLDMQDFRHIVDHVRTQHYNRYLEDQLRYQNSITRFVQGVRINCQGDNLISGLPHLQSFKAGADFFDIASAPKHSIVQLPVSLVLGFPLLVRRIEPGLPWKNRHVHSNELLKYEHNMYVMNVSPAHWVSLTGTLMVARKDKKPLHEAHMQALLGYCQQLDGQMTVDHTADADPNRDLDQEMYLQFENREKKILREASNATFLMYYHVYMIQMGQEKYGDVPSPYHV